MRKLTHLILASFIWNIGKQYSPRCDAAKRGVPSGAILFAKRNFIEKMNFLILPEKVQVGKDQEKAQSEKDSHSKNRGGKKTN